MTAKDKRPTSGGVELTPELLEKLADEAECGYEPQQLTDDCVYSSMVERRVVRRRGRPPVGSDAGAPFQVRLEPELRKALNERAQASDTTPSSVAREAIRRYLEQCPPASPECQDGVP